MKMKKMTDAEIETARRKRVIEINQQPATREVLEAQHGKVWSINEVHEEFEVIGFAAPFMVVKLRKTGEKGSLEFQHSPRFYFNFVLDKKGK